MAQSAQVLSDLNPIDTDWSPFNFYRSKLHLQPNQLHCSPLLTTSICVSSNGSANELGITLLKLCIVCTCANARHRWGSILYLKILLTHKLVWNLVPSVALVGDGIWYKEHRFNDIIMCFIDARVPSPAAISCVNRITGRMPRIAINLWGHAINQCAISAISVCNSQSGHAQQLCVLHPKILHCIS